MGRKEVEEKKEATKKGRMKHAKEAATNGRKEGRCTCISRAKLSRVSPGSVDIFKVCSLWWKERRKEGRKEGGREGRKGGRKVGRKEGKEGRSKFVPVGGRAKGREGRK